MTLLRAQADDEYWAEYTTLVVRDCGPAADREPPVSTEFLAEDAVDAQPGGTIVRAGAGWLQASVTDQEPYHWVRLEVHDGSPPDDHADWDDVAETPYLSGTGSVTLALLTGSEDGSPFSLGPPGRYRVRASCRRGDNEQGDTWRLQFWLCPAPVQPPRWLVRSRPATEPAEFGWSALLGHDLALILDGAQRAAEENPDGASAEQIAASFDQYRQYGSTASPSDVLAEPLWPPEPPPSHTTGHADLDAQEAESHRERLADLAARQRELAGIAAQLGIPAPATVAEMMPLLVRAGLLTVHADDGQRRYRLAADPPRVLDVLTLPPGQAAQLDRSEAFHRYTCLAADLVAIAVWTPGGEVGSVQQLAARLLVTPGELRGALDYAVAARLLHVLGDPDEATAPLTLTVPPPRADEPDFAQPAICIPVTPQDVPSVTGVPPRAGVVTSAGDLVVWRHGEPVLLGQPARGQVYRAIETGYGIVTIGENDDAVLVRPDGRADMLADGVDHRVALANDHRHLALSQWHLGRRPWLRLHLIDLADGSQQILEWPEEEAPLPVAAVRDGAVYFTANPAGAEVSLRWHPGTDPEQLPYDLTEIDPLTGTILADGGARGPLVIEPDGRRHHVPVHPAVQLAPGGTQLYSFRHDPPAVTLFDVAAAENGPRTWWLPTSTEVSTLTPCHPVWEDAGHLLLPVRWRHDLAAVRLDVLTGDMETVPLPATPDGGPVTFVEPVLHGQPGG